MPKHKPARKPTHPKPQHKSAKPAVRKEKPSPKRAPKAKPARPTPKAAPPAKPAKAKPSAPKPKPTPKPASNPSGKQSKPVKQPTSSKPSQPTSGKSKTPVQAAVSAAKTADKRRKPPVAAPRVGFSLEEALELARSSPARAASPAPAPAEAPKPSKEAPARKKAAVAPSAPETRKLGAASLADILGFDPKRGMDPEKDEAGRIPEKWQRYYKLLVELRRHIKEGLTLHSEETLMKSAKDDAGDLSGYSQHMADAGTDTFDRDFALSVVANEQEALNEIEAAIKRMQLGTYGVCELTAKPISRERLLAVPFARYSVESQAEVEKLRRQRAARGAGMVEFEDEEGTPTPAAGGGGEDDGGED